MNYLTARLQYKTLPVPALSKLCLPFGVPSQDIGKVQDIALPVSGKWIRPAKTSMCEHVPGCGWYPKNLQRKGEGRHRDIRVRAVHGTVDENAVMDLGRLLGACLPNQDFSVLVSTLLHVFHFPNCIFSFQMSKFSVLFNVVALKVLFQYLEYFFSLLAIKGWVWLSFMFTSQQQFLPH